MTAPMFLLLVKASALLLAAVAAGRLLRRRAAVDRHRLWSATFAALLALPLLAVALPGFRVPLPAPQPRPAPAAEAPMEAVRAEASRAAPSVPRHSSATAAAPRTGEPVAATTLPSPRTVALAVWLAGALAALGALLGALLRAHRVARNAEVMDDPEWRESASRLAARLGLRRPVRVLASPAVQTPMAGGLLRPTVFVPPSARGWPDELRAMVLAHEIAHLAGRDPLRKVLGRAALTLYWFHPLAWIAARQAAAACEQACDEAVLALGVRPSAYAGALLHFADAAPPVLAGAALPIVRPSSLETRLMAILNSPERPAARRGILLPALTAAALTVCIAAAQPSVSSGAPALARLRPALVQGGAAGPARPAAAERAEPSMAAAVALPLPVAASCRGDAGGSFEGVVSTRQENGVTVVRERVGREGNDVVIQRSFGELKVCARAEGLRDDDALPSTWAARAARVVLETEQGGDLRQMSITGGQATWTVNGAQRGVDASAQAWQSRLLALLDATWEVSRLRGQESSLRGEISSIHGERSSLQGEISSLHGEVSSMQGRISSLRGEESSLAGKISSIRGHVSSLQGQISSEQGAISSLTASARGSDGDAIARRVRQHRDAIRGLEEEIRRYDADGRVREVEREIATLDTDREVAAIERQIAEFDLQSRVAALNRRIAALDVDGRVAAIERQITALDADRRARALEARVDEALERLRAQLRSQ